MPVTVLMHVSNEDPIVAEVDRLPEPTDTCIIVNNPRRRDNKELHNILPEVTKVLYPMHRVHFIEVLPSKGDDDLVLPFRS